MIAVVEVAMWVIVLVAAAASAEETYLEVFGAARLRLGFNT